MLIWGASMGCTGISCRILGVIGWRSFQDHSLGCGSVVAFFVAFWWLWFSLELNCICTQRLRFVFRLLFELIKILPDYIPSLASLSRYSCRSPKKKLDWNQNWSSFNVHPRYSVLLYGGIGTTVSSDSCRMFMLAVISHNSHWSPV